MNIRKIIKEEINDFDWVKDIPSALPKIVLYYERYMSEFNVLDDYDGLGPGTLITGDSGYVDTYEELVDRLMDDMGGEHIKKTDFVEVGYNQVFIKGYDVRW